MRLHSGSLAKKPRRRFAPAIVVALRLGCAAACLLIAAPRAPAAQSVWELTPYRIRVLVAAARKPEITPRLTERVKAAVAERTDGCIGGSWDLHVEDAPPSLRNLMLRSLSDAAFEDLPPELLDGEDDKVILLAIDYRDGSFAVTARDFDLRSRLVTAPVSRLAPGRETLGDDAFRTVAEAFAPLAQIEKVEDKQAWLRLRASALPVKDPSLSSVKEGDVFRGTIRFNDRDGKLRKLMPLDWTFLTVQQINDSELICNLHSGLRSPLSGRRRGKVEQFALLTRAPGGETRLQLYSRPTANQPESSRPLAGYEVYSHPADSPKTTLVGRTDGRGELTVAASATPVQILLVKHGGEPLARLPIMPGLEPTARAEVVDDDKRLAAEGMVTGLQENFVELVANRAVLVLQIRSRIRDGKLEEAKELMSQLRKLGRQDDLSLKIDMDKRSSASPDPRMQRKIDRMFEDTREIVNKFLNQAEIDRVESELAAALRGEKPAASNDSEGTGGG